MDDLKVGEVVRLKSGGCRMTVTKDYIPPEGLSPSGQSNGRVDLVYTNSHGVIYEITLPIGCLEMAYIT